MGKIIIHEDTTKNPITLMGKEAGICYGSDTSNDEKNYKRGLSLIQSGHGRTLEFPQIFMTIDGYSARVIREFYTHIGGAPTRLQASTRYINYTAQGFDYITPPTILSKPDVKEKWDSFMGCIQENLAGLYEMGVPIEDLANGLPLGMSTKVVVRTNARNLIDMSHQRLCARAYWEYRQMMLDITKELSTYSEEWRILLDLLCKPKCEVCGFCTEEKSCGRKPKKEL